MICKRCLNSAAETETEIVGVVPIKLGADVFGSDFWIFLDASQLEFRSSLHGSSKPLLEPH